MSGLIVQNFNQGMDDAAVYWRTVVEAAGLGVWDYNTVTGEKRYSNRWREIHQMSPNDALPATDEDWLAIVHPDDAAVARHYTEMSNIGQADEVSYEYRERTKTGQWIWIMCRGRALNRDSDGRATRFVGVDTDITAIKAAEAARALNARQLEIAVTMAGIGIWIFDFATETVVWDARLRAIYGVSPTLDPLPRDIWERSIHPDDLDRCLRRTVETDVSREEHNLDYRIIRTDGEVRHIRSRISYMTDSLDGPRKLGVNWDVTEDLTQAIRLEQANRVAEQRLAQLTLAQKELESLSLLDPLTGLPNRRSLDEYLQRIAPDNIAISGHVFMLIDIDQFKKVNDTHGHAFGDKLLQKVATILQSELGSLGLVARTGGDEFLAVLDTSISVEELLRIATLAIHRAQEESGVLGQEVSISIGIEAPQGRTATPEEMFVSADKAMYQAKRLGGAKAVLA